ncbi:MAG: radical SAM protein [Deltaproteobacteria bacterium]|nr:radical SAM protein [Deltaproteobacteria bacterium]
MPKTPAPPRLVAWETTRACNLACHHCRAEAVTEPLPDELGYEEGARLLRQLSEFSPPPFVILSGGEPLMREGILDLAALGTSLGLRMLLSTNGTLLTSGLCQKIRDSGIKRLSLSLDGPDATTHDDLRGVPGSFDAVTRAAALLAEAGLPFQINSTITPGNIFETSRIAGLARDLGAVACHVFLLVPTGRARDMETDGIAPDGYESALRELKLAEPFLQMEFKATCAPQYQRIACELGMHQPRSGKGCLGGNGFMFVGHDGMVAACGYLPLSAGSVRESHPVEVYARSPLFLALRDKSNYRGKCGSCEYWEICGGCRARAHAKGDYLGPEPLCPHEPASIRRRASHA